MAKNSGVRDVARVVAEKHGISVKQAEQFLLAIFDVVNDGLKESSLVKIKSLGTFKVIEVKDRESVDVSTGERIVIEGRSKITFTPDAVMKELVNKPFSQFETVVLNDGVDFGSIDEKVDLDEETVATDTPEADETEPIAGDHPVTEQTETSVEDVPLTEQTGITVEDVPIAETEIHAVADMTTEAENEATEEAPAEVDVSTADNKAPDDSEEPVADGTVVVEEANMEDEADADDEAEEVDADQPQPSVEPGWSGLMNTDTEGEETEPKEINEETEMDNNKTNLWGRLLSFLVVAALAFAGGYYIGNILAPTRYVPVVESEMIEDGNDSIMRDSTQINDSIMKSQDARIKQRVDSVTRRNEARNDSLKGAKGSAANRSADEQAKAAKPEASPSPEQNAADKPQQTEVKTNDAQVMNNARQMMAHGAYNIVGTDQIITVKVGQSMKSIARSYLGPGMECYIQVHNGVAEVKVGDKLRIPKLQLKKK